jgi:hypothetical protein
LIWVDVGDSIIGTGMNAHSQLQVRMTAQSPTELQCASNWRLCIAKENKCHAPLVGRRMSSSLASAWANSDVWHTKSCNCINNRSCSSSAGQPVFLRTVGQISAAEHGYGLANRGRRLKVWECTRTELVCKVLPDRANESGKQRCGPYSRRRSSIGWGGVHSQ